MTFILFILYQRHKKSGHGKAWGIATLVVGLLAIVLLATGATIAGVESNQYKSDAVVYNALRTAAVLVGVGVLLMLIGYAILYVLIGRRKV